MDSPKGKQPSPGKPSPGKPLFPLSPERVNRVGTESSTSNSSTEQKRRPKPSSPAQAPPTFELAQKLASDSNRDVQGIVARFDALDIRDHAELRRKDVAALKRAQMGREEAENELRRAREEVRRVKKDLDESNDRERTTLKRLEAVSDDLKHQKQIHTTGINAYEKEMRCARKEAFRSSSAMVKMQEDLKATRASLNKVRTDLDTEKGRARQREQDAFAAQYELVGVQEAFQKERERSKVLECERDALKTQLKEEEVARVAAEGMIALPKASAQNEEDDEFASPRKTKGTPANRTRSQDAMVTKLQLEMQDLHEELDGVQYARDEAENQVEFMKMECQFRCCSCRVAEQSGERFTYDVSLAQKMHTIRPESRFALEPRVEDDLPMEEPDKQSILREGVVPSRPTTPAPASKDESEPASGPEEAVVFSPQSGTFRKSSTSASGIVGNHEQATYEPLVIDNANITTSRPTTYINANGHIHEEEHQPHAHSHDHDMDDQDDQKTFDDTVVRFADADEAEEAYEAQVVDDTGAEAGAMDDEALFDDPAVADEDAEEEDFIIQSPTAHIAATTVTTTVPLAPLSSPAKQPVNPSRAPAPMSTPARTNLSSTSAHDFAQETPAPLPNNDKENRDQRTPAPASTNHKHAANPSTPFDGASAPWTPLAATGLTREEAIERLRARRERERARNGSDEAKTGATPMRAASQGHGKKGAATPGRRDISAPEARSAKR